MDSKNENNKNNLIIIAGILLILAVCLFTLFRASIGNKKSAAQTLPAAKIDSSDQISASDLQKKINNKENLVIVDIREAADFQYEHIENSINDPFSQFDLSGFQGNGKTFVIVDYADSAQLEQVLQLLKNEKITDVLVLSGGITTWKQDGGNVISVGDPTSFTDQAKVTYITSEDLKSAIGGDYPPFIIDVRDAPSYSAGRIPGAINIFLDDLESAKSKVKSGGLIVVYGDDELSGFQAGVRLYDMGFTTVQALQGGFADWQQKGFQIEK